MSVAPSATKESEADVVKLMDTNGQIVSAVKVSATAAEALRCGPPGMMSQYSGHPHMNSALPYGQSMGSNPYSHSQIFGSQRPPGPWPMTNSTPQCMSHMSASPANLGCRCPNCMAYRS